MCHQHVEPAPPDRANGQNSPNFRGVSAPRSSPCWAGLLLLRVGVAAVLGPRQVEQGARLARLRGVPDVVGAQGPPGSDFSDPRGAVRPSSAPAPAPRLSDLSAGIPQVPSLVLTQKLSSLKKMTVCRTLTTVVLLAGQPGPWLQGLWPSRPTSTPALPEEGAAPRYRFSRGCGERRFSLLGEGPRPRTPGGILEARSWEVAELEVRSAASDSQGRILRHHRKAALDLQ
ncbi:uncharacterized protein LOC119003543 isoform X2 [Sturnira hondurensis]|uniref:uncharacterized protein LOC119003543 isoform X2 n=1 Tax=Sturnira hondurensis TaxID=192404 RepID=UPI00187ABE6C|nr:uncharacterized protein LOC119003543 isoform X2 [Sturnira hondurensis]